METLFWHFDWLLSPVPRLAASGHKEMHPESKYCDAVQL